MIESIEVLVLRVLDTCVQHPMLAAWRNDLCIGGQFTTAGGQIVNRAARWDGQAWHPLVGPASNGLSGVVRALRATGEQLVVAGDFISAGSQVLNRSALWDGESWNALGSGGRVGVSGTVRSLEGWNGSLLAGGEFALAGGETVRYLAQWPLCSLGKEGCRAADINGDGVVEGADLGALLAAWGECGR